ncbi:MAG: PAS domain S-box protein, partial [Thermodesulfobacteriota bacterium]
MTSPTSPTDKTPQEQAEIYSALLDQSNDLIHCVSPEGRFIYVNRAWREALGYSDEEIKSLSLMDIIDESLRKRCQGIFAALINGEQLGGKETIFLTRNGEKITVEGRCQTTSKNGQIVSITGIFRDISDRIKTDIALLESEKRFRTLFENSSDIMQIIAVDGRFLHVNSAWLKAFGYSRDEVQALTIFDIISADCQSHCENVFQKVLSSTGVSEIDTTFLAKNGDRVEIEGNATAIFKDGAPIYSQCIFRDVTERRKMEEELLKAHKLESIGVFAGGLAHDFNNLLTAILGNISMARETAPPDISLANRLKTIETATLRAKGLTQQLLTFAKGGAPIKKLSGVGDVIRD